MIFDLSIVAALYTATYLSFVRLLRHPRNWHTPALRVSLATALLVAVTVIYVSATPKGIDLVVLLASTSFIVTLFSIIAAPSIAFRPASRTMEFLAKHGEYTGLWMLAPAIVIGFAIANIKLSGVLATAMVIELVWFLRHRRVNRRRTLYPLAGHDLLVLNKQARGDLKGFAKRHGIRELLLSDSVVTWRGCDKKTLPCPFNLYVNRLGLNTAPCCREHMKELCYVVTTWLQEMGIVYWIEGGTLLGAVREKGTLLPWEDDVDVSVLADPSMTWAALVSGLAERGARDGYSVDAYEKRGYFTICYDPPEPWPFHWQRNRMRGEICLDLVVYRRAFSYGKPVVERRIHKGEMPATESGWHGVPEDLVLPTSTVSFLGSNFSCPNRPEAYLRVLYGDFRKVEYTYVDSAAARTRRQFDGADQRKAPDGLVAY